jgi:hypothetical protein
LQPVNATRVISASTSRQTAREISIVFNPPQSLSGSKHYVLTAVGTVRRRSTRRLMDRCRLVIVF